MHSSSFQTTFSIRHLPPVFLLSYVISSYHCTVKKAFVAVYHRFFQRFNDRVALLTLLCAILQLANVSVTCYEYFFHSESILEASYFHVSPERQRGNSVERRVAGSHLWPQLQSVERLAIGSSIYILFNCTCMRKSHFRVIRSLYAMYICYCRVRDTK